MNDYSLSEVFDTIYRQEFSEFGNRPKHFFSPRHRKAMKEILYPPVELKSAFNRNIPIKRRVIIALLVIILLALSITAGAAISRGFTRKEHTDNTELFAANAENAPQTIEYVYYLSMIPDGYELSETISDSIGKTVIYFNEDTGQTMVFSQWNKMFYNTHLDNERYTLENIEFDGHTGYFLKGNEEDITKNTILWDNGDYIIEISGNFDKNALIKLAKTLKIPK